MLSGADSTGKVSSAASEEGQKLSTLKLKWVNPARGLDSTTQSKRAAAGATMFSSGGSPEANLMDAT